MKQVDKISLAELQDMAKNMYGNISRRVDDVQLRAKIAAFAKEIVHE